MCGTSHAWQEACCYGSRSLVVAVAWLSLVDAWLCRGRDLAYLDLLSVDLQFYCVRFSTGVDAVSIKARHQLPTPHAGCRRVVSTCGQWLGRSLGHQLVATVWPAQDVGPPGQSDVQPALNSERGEGFCVCPATVLLYVMRQHLHCCTCDPSCGSPAYMMIYCIVAAVALISLKPPDDVSQSVTYTHVSLCRGTPACHAPCLNHSRPVVPPRPVARPKFGCLGMILSGCLFVSVAHNPVL